MAYGEDLPGKMRLILIYRLRRIFIILKPAVDFSPLLKPFFSSAEPLLISVRPSVHMEQIENCKADFSICYRRNLPKIMDRSQFLFESDIRSDHFT